METPRFRKITRRWKDVAVVGMEPHDLVEIDEEFYIMFVYHIDNSEILKRLNSGEVADTFTYTFDNLEQKKGSHPNIMIMHALVEKSRRECNCGAKKVKTTHADWCCVTRGY